MLPMGSWLVVAALLLSLGIQQQKQRVPAGLPNLEAFTDAAVQAGSRYRLGDQAGSLAEMAREQLRSGFVARQLSRSRKYLDQPGLLPPDGVAAYRDAQLSRVRELAGHTLSYVDTHRTQMEETLTSSGPLLVQRMDELSGEDAALLLRTSFLFTADAAGDFAAGATRLARDPAVRASAALMVANGVQVASVLATSTDRTARSTVRNVVATAEKLQRKLPSAGEVAPERLVELARHEWMTTAERHPEIQRNLRRVTDQTQYVAGAATEVAGSANTRVTSAAAQASTVAALWAGRAQEAGQTIAHDPGVQDLLRSGRSGAARTGQTATAAGRTASEYTSKAWREAQPGVNTARQTGGQAWEKSSGEARQHWQQANAAAGQAWQQQRPNVERAQAEAAARAAAAQEAARRQAAALQESTRRQAEAARAAAQQAQQRAAQSWQQLRSRFKRN